MRRILLFVFLALAGCAAPRYDIDFDYDTGENWAALKTYDWQPPTGNAVKDELLVKRIRNTVDAGLGKKGLTRSGPFSKSTRNWSWQVCNPPMPEPMMTPTSSRFSSVMENSASASAWRVAAIA